MAVTPARKQASRRRLWTTIQGKLVLLILVLSIPTLLIQSYIYRAQMESRRAQEFQANLEIARAAAKAFETFILDVVHQELSIGLAITSSQRLSLEDVIRLLERSRHGNGAIRDFSWVNREGVFIYSSNPALVGANGSDRTYFRDVIGGREWTVGELILARTTGKPVFGISTGIRDDYGELLGLVVATVVPEKLDAVLSFERGNGGAVSIVDKNGMLVYRYPAVELTWEERNRVKKFQTWKDALDGKEVTSLVSDSYGAKNRMVATTPIVLIGWAAGAGRIEADAMEAIRSSLLPQAVLFVLVTLAALCTALVLSRFISIPIKRLRDHALAIGGRQRVEPVEASGPAELKDLAESFNVMAEELQLRETILNEQRQWLRVTLTSIGDAVITTNTWGLITFLNPVASKLTGWELDEALGRPIRSVFLTINEDTHEPAEDIIGRVLQEGCLFTLANHTALVARDGRIIPIEDSAAPIKDSNGEVSGVVLVFHDVTQSRRAQEALRAREAELRTILENLTEGVAVSDLDGRFLFWSQSGLAMHGFQSLDECRRRLPELTEIFELSTGEGTILPLDEWPLSRILRGETLDDWQLCVRRKDREWQRFFSYNGTLARNAEGNAQLAVVTLRDITERKRMEEELRRARDELEARVHERTIELRASMAKLEQSNQALQEFAYVASHDLQEPLRTISSFVQLLERRYRGKLDPSADEFIGFIVEGSQRMRMLINDLLAYSRVDTQAKPTEPVDLEITLKEILYDLKTAVEETRALITHDPLPVIEADPTQIRQLFQNLVSNAIKFRSDAALRVHISAERSENDWIFSVHDNGIGIDGEFHERIFQVFQRLHANDSCPGTGIGLAVCRKIVQRHGGRIWVESRLGKGATFFFTLPAEGSPSERKPAYGCTYF